MEANGSWLNATARVVTLAVLTAYIASYVYVRTRGIREMEEFDGVGFLYVSADKDRLTPADVAVHERRTILFWPLNRLDRLLGGPSASMSPLIDIESSRPF